MTRYVHEKEFEQGTKIDAGDCVKHGVFYGKVVTVTEKGDKALVDFSNGKREPNLMYDVKLSEICKVEGVHEVV